MTYSKIKGGSSLESLLRHNDASFGVDTEAAATLACLDAVVNVSIGAYIPIRRDHPEQRRLLILSGHGWDANPVHPLSENRSLIIDVCHGNHHTCC